MLSCVCCGHAQPAPALSCGACGSGLRWTGVASVPAAEPAVAVEYAGFLRRAAAWAGETAILYALLIIVNIAMIFVFLFPFFPGGILVFRVLAVFLPLGLFWLYTRAVSPPQGSDDRQDGSWRRGRRRAGSSAGHWAGCTSSDRRKVRVVHCTGARLPLSGVGPTRAGLARQNRSHPCSTGLRMTSPLCPAAWRSRDWKTAATVSGVGRSPRAGGFGMRRSSLAPTRRPASRSPDAVGPTHTPNKRPRCRATGGSA